MSVSSQCFKNLCVFSRSLTLVFKRFHKRKNPIDRDIEYGLPVFQYSVGSSTDRRVYVWGLSEHGALGNILHIRKFRNRLPEFHHVPLRHTFAEQHKVVDIACGYGFTLFAIDTKQKYKVFGCGINSDSQVGYHDPRKDHPLSLITSPAPIEVPLRPETKVKSVSAGRAHSVILTDLQGVFTLGNNAYGQCGRRVIEDEQYTASRVIHHIPSKALGGQQVEAVHCGQDHSLFLTSEGEVYSCGWGADGQLGLGDYMSQWRPTRVGGIMQSERIVKVTGSGDCVLALNDKGDVFGWGNNEYNQLIETEDVQQVCSPILLSKTKSLGKIVDVAAGGSFCSALNDEGDVFVWGYGLLGLGPRVDRSAKPLQIPRTLFGENAFTSGSKVTGLTSGLFHLAAVTSFGHLYTWGHNKGGCLGLGHDRDQFFPLRVNIGAHVLKVSAGVDHTATLCKPFT